MIESMCQKIALIYGNQLPQQQHRMLSHAPQKHADLFGLLHQLVQLYGLSTDLWHSDTDMPIPQAKQCNFCLCAALQSVLQRICGRQVVPYNPFCQHKHVILALAHLARCDFTNHRNLLESEGYQSCLPAAQSSRLAPTLALCCPP